MTIWNKCLVSQCSTYCVHCCKGYVPRQWRRVIFAPPRGLRIPWTDSLKIWHVRLCPQSDRKWGWGGHRGEVVPLHAFFL